MGQAHSRAGEIPSGRTKPVPGEDETARLAHGLASAVGAADTNSGLGSRNTLSEPPSGCRGPRRGVRARDGVSEPATGCPGLPIGLGWAAPSVGGSDTNSGPGSRNTLSAGPTWCPNPRRGARPPRRGVRTPTWCSTPPTWCPNRRIGVRGYRAGRDPRPPSAGLVYQRTGRVRQERVRTWPAERGDRARGWTCPVRRYAEPREAGQFSAQGKQICRYG
jgi:hypothetical protein